MIKLKELIYESNMYTSYGGLSRGDVYRVQKKGLVQVDIIYDQGTGWVVRVFPKSADGTWDKTNSALIWLKDFKKAKLIKKFKPVIKRIPKPKASAISSSAYTTAIKQYASYIPKDARKFISDFVSTFIKDNPGVWMRAKLDYPNDDPLQRIQWDLENYV